MKKKYIAAMAALIALNFSGCADSTGTAPSKSPDTTTANTAATTSISQAAFEIDPVDKDVGYDEGESVNITLSGDNAEISGGGAEFSDGKLTISKGGEYVLSGELNGQIYISAKDAQVKLILNGVNVSNSSHAALFADKADKVTLTLEDGTVNSFSDAAQYTLNGDDDNTDAAIFSRADLTINGTGTLNVSGNYKHGILSKDDLTVTGGEITVDSVSTAISGKDSVKISGGIISLTAGTNGIRSENGDEDDKGIISISGGTISIEAAGDGIDAENALQISDGDLVINTGGGSANASVKSDGSLNGGWGKWGRGDMVMPDGQVPSEMPAAPDGGFGGDTLQMTAFTQTTETTSESSETSSSAKAVKAGNSLEISGGTLTIDSSDDSIHSNGTVNICGGEITASSGDDGVHADGTLLISDGVVTVSKSYEGLEGSDIELSGGTISVTASDDGVNAGGGSDTGSQDRAGRDGFMSSDTAHTLTISGGNITVNASGDGLDSNGDLYMSGGTVFVSGPENGGNGAIDFGDMNCVCQISGGTIIAAGAMGMECGFDESSTQYSVLHNLSASVSGGTEISVSDPSGNVILNWTPEKSYQSVVFSCPELSDGVYTITAGEQSEEITVSSVVTSNSTGMGGGMGGGGFRGGNGGFGGGFGGEQPEGEPGADPNNTVF